MTGSGWAHDLLNGTDRNLVILEVVAWGLIFLAAEKILEYSAFPRVMTKVLLKNPEMTEDKAHKCVPLIVTRIIGFVHNTAQLPIAIWTLSHPEIQARRIGASDALSHHMLCIAAGFFLHDAVCCLLRESPFYVIHGVTCCFGYSLAAVNGCGHFYGALFLLWEMSTPFVQLRWVLMKMGLTESIAYICNGITMVVVFGLARVVFGTLFVLLLFYDTYIHVMSGSKEAPNYLIFGFCGAASIVSCLNYWWFSLMLKSLYNIFVGGSSWRKASEGKNE